MVATLVFSYTYSSMQSGESALTWSWTGYAAAASHLLLVVLHNTADIPIDFYLPNSGVSTPGSRMVGLGLDWYPQLDMALMGLSVLVFLSAHRSRQWVFFGVAVLAMNYLALYDIVWHQLSKQQYLVIMLVVTHLLPMWAGVIENF